MCIDPADFFAMNIRQLNAKIAENEPGPTEDITTEVIKDNQHNESPLIFNDQVPITAEPMEKPNYPINVEEKKEKERESLIAKANEDGLRNNIKSEVKKSVVEKKVKEEEKKVKEEEKKLNMKPPITQPQIKNPKQQAMKFDSAGSMWVDKYAPKTLKEFVGNSEVIEALRKWMQDWEKINLRGQERRTSFGSGRQNAKACLLSGPPGIGKSTAAKLAAKEFGYEILETNASDQRSKKVINDLLANTVDNKSINLYVDDTTKPKKIAIIMDEIDGVSGTNDKGGIAALIKIIATTKMPIICICNDRQSQKVRSLAFHCYDLKFMKYTFNLKA